MPLTDKQRNKIVEITKSWLKTPYKGWSHVKGCGVDCGQLLAAVFVEAGHFPKTLLEALPKDYSLQVAQHRASTEYIELVEKFMCEIPESEVKPGDVVAYKLGLAFAHAGIVIEWPNYIIHAVARHGVVGADGKREPIFRHKAVQFYTLKEEYVLGAGE